MTGGGFTKKAMGIVAFSIMVGFTILLYIIIPHELATVEKPVTYCNISYISSRQCSVCDLQIAEIQSANTTCKIPIINESNKYYGLIKSGKQSPFWLMDDGEKRDDLFTREQIEQMVN